MKKKILALLLAVATASMFAGCGKDDGGRERESREESSYEQEESAPESVSEPEEPEEAPLLTSAYASANPGNEFQFGAYEQDNNLSDGAEPIEWVVLANEGDRILVLSKYVLVGEPEEMSEGEIRDDAIPGADRDSVTWEVCSERKWLNSIFYEEAFSDEERNCILQSELTTPDTEGTWSGRSNQPFHTYGGSDTTDYLFLLSYEEFKEYVKPLKIANAEPTAASAVKANKETGYASWQLRSPGVVQDWVDDMTMTSTGYSDEFAEIGSDESGDIYGELNSFHSGRVYNNPSTGVNFGGLRMAMWLKVE